MYTDIAGFSRMMENDEAGTLDLLTYHNDLIAGIVNSHHGTVIKTIGDALLVDFKNTVEAIQSAMEIQDRLYEHNKENPGLPLLVRIGLHLGDIYFFENDALGEGINIAARLQSLARPGCICFSQDVYNLVLNKIEFHAEKLGKVSLKNITKEIHAYEITTPNVEFDPNRDKPRPGYTPASYKDGEEAADAPQAEPQASPEAPQPAAPSQAAQPAKPTRAEAARSYTPEGSANLLSEIRKAILEETKTLGRRLTVSEAREKYGFYGVEAQEVIAAMADQGLIIKRNRADYGDDGEEGTDYRDRPMAAPSSLPSFIAGFGRNERGEFDSGALKSGIEAAVSGIVGEIERSVERNMSTEDRDRFAEKMDRYADRGRDRERSERHRERRERKEAERNDIEALRGRLERRNRSARSALIGNLTSYLAVNGFLLFLGIMLGGGLLHAALPIVAAGWGIGLAASFVGFGRSKEKLREVEAMPDLEGEAVADYRKLSMMKDSIVQHASSTVMVSVLLGIIFAISGSTFPWVLIPVGAMVVGLFSHLAAFGASKGRLERRILDSLGIKGGWGAIFKRGKAMRVAPAELGAYADLYKEAQEAKQAIAAQLASGQAGQVDPELAPSLDQYLGQVRLLAQSANEIDRLVESIPMNDLSADRAALVAKEASAGSSSLKAEYRKSIEEIDKQESSYGELKEQSEVVKLRLGSSVNQLKQMRLDIARLSASPGAEGGAGLEALKRRTDELSHYLEDLRSGYSESGIGSADPFAQLEAEEKKRLEAEASGPEGARPKGALEEPKA
jgi:class 3 adenylate cyclase